MALQEITYASDLIREREDQFSLGLPPTTAHMFSRMNPISRHLFMRNYLLGNGHEEQSAELEALMSVDSLESDRLSQSESPKVSQHYANLDSPIDWLRDASLRHHLGEYASRVNGQKVIVPGIDFSAAIDNLREFAVAEHHVVSIGSVAITASFITIEETFAGVIYSATIPANEAAQA